jgi:anti-sigma factor RsiW
MSCAPFDLRDYFLGELAEAERAQVRQHARTCEHCADELRRLETMQAALLSVRDEEIPQRIAFVSDRVYEPSAMRRWWSAFWSSAPRLGFASAAMLSAAILVYSQRPVPVAGPAQTVDVQAIRAEFQQQLDTAVRNAVMDLETRHARELQERVSAVEHRFEQRRKQDVRLAEEAFAEMSRKLTVYQRASLDFKDPQ